MIVEVCASSIASVKNAAQAGADRIELCSALGVGGITPSKGLIAEAVALDLLPIYCLIRPREGHFIYSDSEVNVISQDVLLAKEMGCKGVVLGALTQNFNLDKKRLKHWISLAGSMSLTFHRAFDVVTSPMEALQILIDLGFNSVLTSGQEEKAIDGLVNLKNWHNNLGAQITIMPGSGINASNCLEFKKYGFKALHLSGSKLLPSISIPEKVNSKISFLHQKIGESNQKNIRAVVDKLTN